jgi:uncharacterized protein YceH (UPF0502 family)
MSTPPESGPSWKPLAPAQRRVLGVLVEKAKTTPAGYPMSVNAIVIGCNQKNNRDPLTSYDEADVGNALSELERLGAVQEVDWMGRVPKYKHRAHEWLGVRPVGLAVVTELLLRGAQPLGELRARASRMEPIEDLVALKPIVEDLLARGLMLELTPPGRGQVVTHALYSAPELEELRSGAGARMAREAGGGADEPSPRRAGPVSPALETQLAELRVQIARLEERIAELERR